MLICFSIVRFWRRVTMPVSRGFRCVIIFRVDRSVWQSAVFYVGFARPSSQPSP